MLDLVLTFEFFYVRWQNNILPILRKLARYHRIYIDGHYRRRKIENVFYVPKLGFILLSTIKFDMEVLFSYILAI